jgi:glycosyltransferase involved in cell wall biosynthesis
VLKVLFFGWLSIYRCPNSAKILAMSSHKKPRFSIVIPAYNEEEYIGFTLASLSLQDFKGDYEVIVVDSNCTDNTVSIAKKHNAKVIVEDRTGVCWARQAGTEAARGEIVVSTDADTIFDSNWLTNIDEQFRKKEDLVAVCAACEFINPPWWGKIYPKLLFGAVYGSYLLFKRPFYITATNTAFKKSAWDGYDMEQTQGGDELALLHKLRRRGRVSFTNKYVVHTSSRRLNHGLWYNVFVSFLFYYLMAYYINKLFNRRIIGTAPAYRQKGFSEKGYEMFAKLAMVISKKDKSAADCTPKDYKLPQKVVEKR